MLPAIAIRRRARRKKSRRRVKPAAWRREVLLADYLDAVYVTCRPKMFTLLLYEPLSKPLAAVLPAF